MVEYTGRRILSQIISEHNGVEILSGDFVRYVDPPSETAESPARSSKAFSSLPSEPISCKQSASQSPFLYSSSAPLLPQPKTVPKTLETLPLQRSHQAAWTSLALPGRGPEEVSHLANCTHINPVPRSPKSRSWTELLNSDISAGPCHLDQIKREVSVRAKGELRFHKPT